MIFIKFHKNNKIDKNEITLVHLVYKHYMWKKCASDILQQWWGVHYVTNVKNSGE